MEPTEWAPVHVREQFPKCILFGVLGSGQSPEAWKF